MQLNCSYLTIK